MRWVKDATWYHNPRYLFPVIHEGIFRNPATHRTVVFQNLSYRSWSQRAHAHVKPPPHPTACQQLNSPVDSMERIRIQRSQGGHHFHYGILVMCVRNYSCLIIPLGESWVTSVCSTSIQLSPQKKKKKKVHRLMLGNIILESHNP